MKHPGFRLVATPQTHGGLPLVHMPVWVTGCVLSHSSLFGCVKGLCVCPVAVPQVEGAT